MGKCTTYVLPSQDGLAVDYQSTGCQLSGKPVSYIPRCRCMQEKLFVMEERLEFGMEGHRFFDLVRWGIVAETINDYMVKDREFRSLFGGASPKTFTAGKNEYAPIPTTQIELQNTTEEILTQNPGY